MRKIYFGRKSIIICPPDQSTLLDPNAILFPYREGKGLAPLADIFKSGDSPTKVYVPTHSIDKAYESLCSCFREVNAAGGLVTNRRGDYLFIKRNGMWDLPKGHQEEGEDLQTCALREVEEETGINTLELQSYICTTDHCYFRDGLWHLKHSWWYSMLDSEPIELTPQREEDITKATWLAKSAIPFAMENTYPSIEDVVKLFLKKSV